MAALRVRLPLIARARRADEQAGPVCAEVSVSSIFGVAQSGLEVASLRLAVSAHNVANAETSGFVPSRVEPVEAPSGVGGAVVKPNDPQFEARVDRALVAA